jgi:hypothetical protein
MKKSQINVILAAGVVALLLFSGCAIGKINSSQSTTTYSTQQKNTQTNNDAVITCSVGGIPASQTISYESGIYLKELFSELVTANAQDPSSVETQHLQQKILQYAEQQALLPAGISADMILTQFEKRRQILATQTIAGDPVSGPGTNQQFFCNFVSTGEGSAFPIIILPRFIPIIMAPIPRLFVGWKTPSGITSCGGLMSGTGFIASGQQQGLALGFWGIGFSIFLPPVMAYGMFGYALYAKVTAEEMEYWPPNNPPEIVATYPLDGATNLPLSTSELQFHINDYDGDLMSYSVTTYPDIGGGNGNLKTDGTYTVPISGLKSSTEYTWDVTVSDNKETTSQQFSFCTIETPFNPYDDGWQYRKQISINHSQVAGNLDSFPVFIHVIDPDLQTKAQSDGGDILFMNGPGVATKLYHEVERYESSNGELLAWVNIINLAADEDTILYMYYGNPDSVNTQMSKRVWDPSFVGVWHLNDFQDSTKNGNHGSNHGSIAMSGKLGDARRFDGSDDYILVENDPSLNFQIPNRFSVSLWMKRDRLNTYESIISKATSSHMEGYAVQIRENNTILFVLYDGSQEYLFHSNQVIVDTNWHYITAVWDGTHQYIFIDGVLDNSIDIGPVTIADDSKPLEFGHHYGYMSGQNPYAGSIDEIQISKIDRNAYWIITEYQNQNNPSGFFDVGPEEPGP